MPRAIGCFRHIGFQADAYPVDFTIGDPSNLFVSFPTGSEALFLFDVIAKEWLGLIAYRLSGKIDTLFLGPRHRAAYPRSSVLLALMMASLTNERCHLSPFRYCLCCSPAVAVTLLPKLLPNSVARAGSKRTANDSVRVKSTTVCELIE